MATCARTRSGRRMEVMHAARLPQSNPASAIRSSPSASAKSTTSCAMAACSAMRGASGSRNRVAP